MIVEVTLFTAVVWGLLLVSQAGSTYIEPSIGDVMLSDTQGKGTVMIYFSDGIHRPQWGTICAKKSLPNAAKVVCRQLGLGNGHKSLARPPSSALSDETVSSNTSSPRIWLTDVDCGAEDTSFSHILQCTYSVLVTDNTENMCQNDDLLHVTCDPMTNSPYVGQVRLCSPNGFPDGVKSVSMGLVQIYLYGAWGGINQYNSSHPLGSYTGDSICRQLGYTNAVAGSAMTQMSASSILSNSTNVVSFNKCYHIDAEKQAWFKTEQVKCDHSEDCFGCCFSYPARSNLCNDCYISKDVVIRCTFDRTIFQEVGQKKCSFESESDLKSLKHSACTQQEIWLTTFEITVGVVGSLALILFIALCIVPVVYCSYRYRVYHRARLPPQGQGQRPQLLRQQDDEN